MRITNLLVNRQKLSNYQMGQKSVFDLNNQLASKMKITQPFEDAGIYVDATRLDYELATLEQVKEATTKAGEFAQNTDYTLNSFSETLTTFKTKLIQAANEGEHNTTSRVAIANDLQALRDMLVTTANTAINGQFLFSGTAVDTKPISSDGKYHGNDQDIKVVAGAHQMIPYNIDGAGLFLGRDNDYSKVVTTNITLINAHEELNPVSPETYIRQTDNIYKLIGTDYQTEAKNKADGKMDYVSDFEPDDIKNLPSSIFFMQGQRPNGESFSVKFELTAGATIEEMMEQMGRAMGNTDTNQVVEITMHKNAQIEMKNLQNGSEIMSFSMFALTAQTGTAGETLLSTDDIKALTSQEAIDDAITNNKAHLTSFISSPAYSDEEGNKLTNADYDEVRFEKNGSTISANTSQIVRKDNSFATDATRLSEVAGLSDGGVNSVGGAAGALAVTSLKDANNLVLNVVDRHGKNLKATIDFNGTTITDQGETKTYPTITIEENGVQQYKGNFYKTYWDERIDQNDRTKQIGDQAKLVETDDLSFKEINDMLTILAGGTLDKMAGVTENTTNPSPTDLNNAFAKFNETLKINARSVEATMDHRGHITLKDKTTSVSQIEVAMYEDRDGKDYPAAVGTDKVQSSGVLSFHKNDAVIIDRPSIDFFADLDDMIRSVRDGSFFGNPDGTNHRTAGVQGAIERLDHIMDHVNKEHAIAGSNSRLVKDTYERSELLTINVATVKSDVIDADFGEVMMRFQERLLAYQAMLQATSKISNISLLNYM